MQHFLRRIYMQGRRVIWCLCWLLHLRMIFDSSNLQCRWCLGLWGWREMEAEDCFAISRKVIATGPCEWGRAEIQRTPGVAGMEFQPHIWKDNRLCALQKIHGNTFLCVCITNGCQVLKKHMLILRWLPWRRAVSLRHRCVGSRWNNLGGVKVISLSWKSAAEALTHLFSRWFSLQLTTGLWLPLAEGVRGS